MKGMSPMLATVLMFGIILLMGVGLSLFLNHFFPTINPEANNIVYSSETKAFKNGNKTCDYIIEYDSNLIVMNITQLGCY